MTVLQVYHMVMLPVPAVLAPSCNLTLSQSQEIANLRDLPIPRSLKPPEIAPLGRGSMGQHAKTVCGALQAKWSTLAKVWDGS